MSAAKCGSAALGVQPLDHTVQRQVLVGVEMENAFDVGGFFRVNLDDTTTVLADVAVAVGSQAEHPLDAGAGDRCDRQ